MKQALTIHLEFNTRAQREIFVKSLASTVTLCEEYVDSNETTEYTELDITLKSQPITPIVTDYEDLLDLITHGTSTLRDYYDLNNPTVLETCIDLLLDHLSNYAPDIAMDSDSYFDQLTDSQKNELK